MNRLESIGMDNDIYRVEYDEGRDMYIGIITHPVTGKEVERLEAKTERALRTKLLNWIYRGE